MIPVTEDSDITYNLEVSNVEESKGQLIIGGLLPGEYYITEMKAPNGYLLLKTPVKIEVTKNGTIEVRSGSGSSQKDDDGIDWVRIRNMGAYYLPSTGGAGTIPYTAAGILMMASSWYAFRRRKRRSVWKQTDQAV